MAYQPVATQRRHVSPVVDQRVSPSLDLAQLAQAVGSMTIRLYRLRGFAIAACQTQEEALGDRSFGRGDQCPRVS